MRRMRGSDRTVGEAQTAIDRDRASGGGRPALSSAARSWIPATNVRAAKIMVHSFCAAAGQGPRQSTGLLCLFSGIGNRGAIRRRRPASLCLKQGSDRAHPCPHRADPCRPGSCPLAHPCHRSARCLLGVAATAATSRPVDLIDQSFGLHGTALKLQSQRHGLARRTSPTPRRRDARRATSTSARRSTVSPTRSATVR